MAEVWRKLNLIVTADGGVRELLSDEPPEEASQAVPVRKLAGKEWIEAALKRRPQLRALLITEAGRQLSEESKTARDCAKPLSVGRCINILRDFFAWPKKPRNSPKQRPK